MIKTIIREVLILLAFVLLGIAGYKITIFANIYLPLSITGITMLGVAVIGYPLFLLIRIIWPKK
ncbi:MAG: hypothetical protein ISS92_03595 [Candidatus Omnitrophica bacterium]|nr:hypothetical protein [Candidatus Omnitrophota bacterium]